MTEKISVGFSEENITPSKTINLTGQFYDRIAEFVETPITVTAMAVKTESEQMVILSCDLTSIFDSLVEQVRDSVRGYKDLDADKVIINATHTHTSHTYDGRRRIAIKSSVQILERYSGGKQFENLLEGKSPEMNEQEATEFLVQKMSDAVKNAWDKLSPAYYQFGFGRAAVGMCRRVTYDDGSALMWGDTNTVNFTALEGGNDSGIEIGFFYDEQKNLKGVMANVACPSQICEHRSFISSDFWGKVKILLRERFGNDLFVLPLCSAAGDMCPRDLVRWVEPETPINDPNIKRVNPPKRNADPSMFDIRGTWKAGKRIAREIIDAFEELNEEPDLKDSAEFVHEVKLLNLPFRRVTIKERNDAEKEIVNFFKNFEGDTISFEDNAKMHLHAGIIGRYEDQQTIETYPAEVHVIRFGNIAIATNPFELFLDYGNQIRARSKAEQTFLIQLACGKNGYLPTKKAEQGSHYSAYVTSGTVGHAGGDQLVRETVETINKMFNKE